MLSLICITGPASAYYDENIPGQAPMKNFTPDQSLKSYMSTDQGPTVRFSSFGIEKAPEPWRNKLSFQLLQLLDNSTLSSGFGNESLQMQLERQHLFIPANQPFIDNLTSAEDLVLVEIEYDPGVSDQWSQSELFRIVDQDLETGIVVGYVPIDDIEQLALQDAVLSIKFVVPSITHIGAVTSEGDAIHRTSQVRMNTLLRGTGIKVGVISDSVDHLANAQATGDLPYNVHVLRNSNPFDHTDEGIAMLEIIYDLAPGAELYFHDNGGSSTGFTSAVNALRAAGCDIICDDLTLPDQPSFEDGAVATNIKNILSSDDVVYVTSAGNLAGNHYQGFFYDQGNNLHDFSNGMDPEYKDLYFTLGPGGEATVVLQWSDKWGQSGNDYDLGIFDEYGNLVSASIEYQNGKANPFEICSVQNIDPDQAHYCTIVVERTGSAQYRYLEVFILTSGSTYVNPHNMITADSIFEHAAVNEVISVGAIDSQDLGNNEIEPFSSQGPVTILYPFPETRVKPDICGIDNVKVTGVGGFPTPFQGTSASAPHIAGIVALIWSGNPTLPAGGIRSALLSSAYDLGTPGKDPVFGYGLANAENMLSLVYIPTPTPTTQTPTQTTQPTTATPTPTTSPTPTNPEDVPPMELWGDVTDGGSPAPEGSIILAKIANNEKARISIVSAGRYGGSGAFDQRLKIVLTQADIAAGYPEISFWMNGKEATQKVRFNPGSSQQLDLTFSPPLTSPTATPTPTVTTTVTPTPTVGPAEMTLDLFPGWNFVSTPKTLREGYETAKIVFGQVNTQAHSIYRYDAQSQAWISLNADDPVRPLDGIWVYSTQRTQIVLKFKNDPVQTPPTKQVFQGWNCIGFSDTTPASARESLTSISNIWSILLGFDAEYQYYQPSIINGGSGSHSDSNLLSPGKGYWIFTNGPGTLAAIGV